MKLESADDLIVPVQKLPCGLDYDFNFISIKPLVFLDLIYHARNYSSKADKYTKMMYHFNLARKKVSHFDELRLPDAFFAVYMMYLYSFGDSISLRFTYACTMCGTENSEELEAKEIIFKKFTSYKIELSIPYIKYEQNKEQKIDFDKHVFIFPKVSYIMQNLGKMYDASRKRIYDLDFNLFLMSHEDYNFFPKEIEEYLNSFTTYAAWIMMNFLNNYFRFLEDVKRRCKKCGHVNSVDVSNIIFTDFLASGIKIEDMIQLKSYLGSKHFYNVEMYTLDVLNKAVEVFVEEEEKQEKENRTTYSMSREGIKIS